jgi:hypothetical protein
MARDLEALPFLRALLTAANDPDLSDSAVRTFLLEADTRVIGLEEKKKDDPSNIIARIGYSQVDGVYQVERYNK